MKKYIIIFLLVILLTGCKTKTYTVTFVDNYKELAKIEVKKGDNITDIDNPTKEGYIFLNWVKDGLDYNTERPINEDITLEATWTPIPNPVKTYTITFDFGDNKIKTVDVKEGDKVNVPKETPRKEKYKFLGWYIDDTEYNFDTPIDKDLTITEKKKKNRIIINYDLVGGSGTIQVEIEKGHVPNKPKNPSKFGYTFINWMIGDNIYNFDTPLYEDTTIKANYEANVYYRVSFDTDGGNEIVSQMIVSGHTIGSLPTAIKDGYNFKYWTYNGNQFDINTPITDDITLVALYEKNN